MIDKNLIENVREDKKEINIHKTPKYQRKANKDYYDRNKNDPEFIEKLRIRKREEYEMKKNDPIFMEKRRIASRILSTNKEKWWTVSAFYSECDEIRENEDKMFSFKTVDEKLKFLDGINDYVMNLEQKYSDA